MSITKRKKLLVLANNDVGLYKFRKELLQELIKLGYEVHIALPYGKFVDKLVNFGCIFHETPLERRGMNPIKDVALFLIYKKLINLIKPHMVITYTIKPNIYGGLAARLSNVDYAVNITGIGSAFQHENILKNLLTFMYRLSLKNVKVVFFENAENQKTFLHLKIVSKERTCVLNGAGVNLDEYPYTPYPEDNGETRFLFIGRIMREKGVDELFEVAKQIRNEYPNVFFDIVGPMEENYKDIVDELVGKNIINYFGYQEDVRSFIARSHCVVLPSYHEGMSNTLLEAGAMGRPLIATNIPGCHEIVSNNYNGMLINKQCLKKSMLSIFQLMINHDYHKRKEMGLNSRIIVFEKFSRDRVIETVFRRLNE